MSGDVAMETISSSSSKLLSDDRQEGDETKEPKESSPVPEDERDPSTLTAFADPKQETEAQRAAEMFDRRGSRMEDTGDIQVLSALPEFQLLLPSRDWSDRSWTLRRLLCRLATLFVLVAMMVVVVTIGGFYGSNNRYTEGFLPLNLTLYNFRLDGCYLDFYANQGPDVVDSSHVRISLYVEYWTGLDVIIDPNSGIVQILDTRLLGDRYRYNECVVKVFVPVGVVLPEIVVDSLGYKDSWVNASDISLGEQMFTLNIENPLLVNAHVSFINVEMGGINATYDRGTIKATNSIIHITANITLGEGSFLLSTNHSTDLIAPSFNSSHICVSGSNVTCINSTCSVDSPVPFPRPIITVNKFIPPVTLSTSPAMGFIQLAALTPTPIDDMVYPGRSVAVNFTLYDQQLLQSTLALNPDLLEVQIMGPGLPNGLWLNTNTFFYVALSLAYMNVFSWHILNPYILTTKVNLEPAFCPGLTESSNDFENIIYTSILLRNTLGTNAKPYIILQTPNINPFSPQGLNVYRDPSSGTYFLQSISVVSNVTVILTVVFNLAVSFLVSVYVVFVMFNKLEEWRASNLEDWGEARFGENGWKKQKEEIFNRAGIFFLVEFMVGFPKGREGLFRVMFTVFLHIFLIVLPVAPIIVAAVIYQLSVATTTVDLLRFYTCGPFLDLTCSDIQSYPSFYIPVALYIICLVSVIFGIASLLLYYFEVLQHVWARGIRKAYTVVVLLVSPFSLAYIVNVSFWVVLGCILQPTTILPISAIILVLIFHLVSTVARVRELTKQLYENIDEHQDAVNAVASVEQFAISDVSKFSTKDIFTLVQKSQILEITGLSIWQKIVQEIVIFLIMILFYAFLCAGFLALTPSSQFVSALTTGIVFLIGGGINIPLSRSSQTTEERQQWLESIRQQAKTEQQQQMEKHQKKMKEMKERKPEEEKKND